MPARRSLIADFNQRRAKEGWTRLVEYNDFQQFTNFVTYTGDTYHKKFGPDAMAQVKKFYPEVEQVAGPEAPKRGPISISLDESASQNSFRSQKYPRTSFSFGPSSARLMTIREHRLISTVKHAS